MENLIDSLMNLIIIDRTSEKERRQGEREAIVSGAEANERQRKER